MIAIAIVAAVFSVLSSISNIRKNRRDRGKVALGSAAAAAVTWPINPTDLVDGLHDLVHWAYDGPIVDSLSAIPPASLEVPSPVECKTGRVGGILDIGKIVEKVGDLLDRADTQGFVDIRIMLPSKKVGG